MASALTGGYHLAFLIGAGLVLVATVVAAVLIEKPEPEAASPSAEPAFSEG